jgi:hypothetical protein
LPATYLAGGVAVAVHLGHRRSRDLDLFTYGDAVSIEPFRARFGKSEADLYHIARSLTFFDDAERDPVLPEGMTPRRWARIRADFESLAATLLPR